MNSYEQMITSIDKFYYNKTTSVPDNIFVYENRLNIQWNNKLAIQRVYEVSKLLNKDPDLLGKEPGQSAIWFNPKSKIQTGHYHKFEIQDQAYQHTKPERHADFFFVWLKMELKPEKAAMINKITSSAFYYQPGQLVCSSCHFIEASIATFSVLKEFNDDKINLEQARQIYDIRIEELFKEFMKSEQSEDINTYSTPLRDIFETYIMSDMLPNHKTETTPVKEFSAIRLAVSQDNISNNNQDQDNNNNFTLVESIPGIPTLSPGPTRISLPSPDQTTSENNDSIPLRNISRMSMREIPLS